MPIGVCSAPGLRCAELCPGAGTEGCVVSRRALSRGKNRWVWRGRSPLCIRVAAGPGVLAGFEAAVAADAALLLTQDGWLAAAGSSFQMPRDRTAAT